MKAAVFHGGGQPVAIEEVEIRDPGPGEVRVAIKAAGLCHSDLSVIDGTIPFPVPVVLGHEGAGVVEQIGSAVTRVAVGDHVILTANSNCGSCRFCASGRPTWCRSAMAKKSQRFTTGGDSAWTFA